MRGGAVDERRGAHRRAPAEGQRCIPLVQLIPSASSSRIAGGITAPGNSAACQSITARLA